jgi:hypothetical protein
MKHEHAHEVVVKNGGCITSHNKLGEQAFFILNIHSGKKTYSKQNSHFYPDFFSFILV